MASLILPRSISIAVDYSILNYFMTALVGGITLAANTATDIGPAEESWGNDTGTAVTQFAVNVYPSARNGICVSTHCRRPSPGGRSRHYGIRYRAIDSSATAATIPGEARIIFTIFQVVPLTLNRIMQKTEHLPQRFAARCSVRYDLMTMN